MIKDMLVSFRDNIKERTTNPFLGTYLLVWLIRNWKLTFALFNFDSDQKLQHRIDFITSYFSERDAIGELGENIVIALILLTATYVFLNISRFIINVFEKQLTPWIYRITDSSSIVLKSTYQAVVREKDYVEQQLEKERESRSKLENRFQRLQDEFESLSRESSVNSPKDSNNSNSGQIAKYDVDLLVQKLTEKNLQAEFLDSSLKIDESRPFEATYLPIQEFNKLGLVKYSGTRAGGKIYNLQPVGEAVLKKIRLLVP